MAHTDAKPVSASAVVSSVGKGIRYIGNHAMAYSGQTAAGADADALLLDFTSGSGYIVGQFQFTYATDTLQDADARYTIKLNGEIVIRYWDFQELRAGGDPHQPLPMVIPPFTRVETLANNVGAGSGQLMCSTFTGRVYGAE